MYGETLYNNIHYTQIAAFGSKNILRSVRQHREQHPGLGQHASSAAIVLDRTAKASRLTLSIEKFEAFHDLPLCWDARHRRRPNRVQRVIIAWLSMDDDDFVALCGVVPERAESCSTEERSYDGTNCFHQQFIKIATIVQVPT